MKKCVYSVLDEGPVVKKLLEENGFQVVIGNGTLEPEKLAVCDALIPGKSYVTDKLLENAPRLKIVSKFGVGVDKIDIPACTKRGIWVSNTALTNYIPVAEHTVALMLTAAKKLPQITRVFQAETPDWQAGRSFRAIELNGKTLSVIGLGNIGRRVASIASAFGMQVVGFDPYAKPGTVPDFIVQKETLEETVACGDFITLHVAGGESVRDLINARIFALMKPTAILINTTRGFVVNEQDLIDALKNGVIAGAALDVFLEEPVIKASALFNMENVIVTPHNAANTAEAKLRSQQECANNIIAVFQGGHPPFALNDPSTIS